MMCLIALAVICIFAIVVACYIDSGANKMFAKITEVISNLLAKVNEVFFGGEF